MEYIYHNIRLKKNLFAKYKEILKETLVSAQTDSKKIKTLILVLGAITSRLLLQKTKVPITLQRIKDLTPEKYSNLFITSILYFIYICYFLNGKELN